MINILFSSVGRRVELVNAFKNAKDELKIEGTLVGADMDELAPALNFVDKKYIVPKILSDEFIPSIIEICKKENISLIIPTLDTELHTYAKNKELIERESGAKVMVSDENVIEIIRNKVKTYEFLKENGFNAPKLITDKDIKENNYTFPLFIKPLDGSSSVNNFKINNLNELVFFKEYVPNPIIQEFVEGIEYCVDIFTDLEGNLISISPKERLAHRGGEITKAKIIEDNEIIEISKKLVEVLKPKGEINFDCIKTKYGINIIEINGRFAGGAPISFKAGANSPLCLYKILNGENVNFNKHINYGMIALRFDSAIYINKID
ncbi:ATP-grasp domain-containing protein [Clostridium perfringens]|uniref:ATP-grasp domain-containing protein n=1 Tax=Clostridium perfringens TaxID=1502 RepID=UPI0018E490F8|nr:ATP-grasp domain-containing protein [Clostridium perfringens]MBI6001463.1 ATP-grasp domain-containing protein [Clostridium perfringens]MDK0557886.1 ATP-grasp domain-containing protein [Clostridium perfringens]MDZ4956704.1 ATP-grasp domain-containing protein [Clostridium perfringens]